MNRKDFIRSCGLLGLGSLGLNLFESCGSNVYYAQYQYEKNTLHIALSEFSYVNKDQQTTQRNFVLLKVDKLPFPICVYRLPDGQYSALYLECPHSGCEVRPQPDHLLCPCHGSEFSNRGQVLNPPAEQDLQQFKTSSDKQFVYLYLNT